MIEQIVEVGELMGLIAPSEKDKTTLIIAENLSQ